MPINEGLLDYLDKWHGGYYAEVMMLYRAIEDHWPQFNHTTRISFVSYPSVDLAILPNEPFPFYDFRVKLKKGRMASLCRFIGRERWWFKPGGFFGWNWLYRQGVIPPAPPSLVANYYMETIQLETMGYTNPYQSFWIRAGYSPRNDTLFIYRR